MIPRSFSPEARRDLVDLIAYISDEDPDAAERVRVAIFAATEKLNVRPAMGHRRPDLTGHPVRFWPVMRRYVIVYRNEAPPIEVVRVFGPGRDIASLLR